MCRSCYTSSNMWNQTGCHLTFLVLSAVRSSRKRSRLLKPFSRLTVLLLIIVPILLAALAPVTTVDAEGSLLSSFASVLPIPRTLSMLLMLIPASLLLPNLEPAPPLPSSESTPEALRALPSLACRHPAVHVEISMCAFWYHFTIHILVFQRRWCNIIATLKTEENNTKHRAEPKDRNQYSTS